MNRFIYNDKEQQRKEQQREIEKQENNQQVLSPATPIQQASKVETMLIQTIVRDGEKLIIRDVLNEETGEKINLNVAQYIAYDLGLDNLSFKNPLSVQILNEALEHSEDEKFLKQNEYFTHHPDYSLFLH